eukprot:s2404_g1.t4
MATSEGLLSDEEVNSGHLRALKAGKLCGKPWSTTGRSTTAEASSSAKQKAAGARETSTGPFEVRKAVVPRCKLDLRCFLVRAIAPRCENRPLEVVVS